MRLSGPWYVSSDDGYTGIFIVEKMIDDASCEARLSVFSPVGESVVEACRVLRSDKVVIYCEITSASFFFKAPDNLGSHEIAVTQAARGESARASSIARMAELVASGCAWEASRRELYC